MTVLFGHPTGNPNSHHAALAHFEAGHLEAFCVPWMPSQATLAALARIPPIRPMAGRLARRHFAALADAPKIQGRMQEMGRLLTRACGRGDERLSYEANDWLMQAMARACTRPAVRAVHAYEDCSLLQFEQARRTDKACIYDMPIGYYAWWERKQRELAHRYADWLPPAASLQPHVRPEQKRREMELADLVLTPGSFVRATIAQDWPGKEMRAAPYGVDADFWHPAGEGQAPPPPPLRFIFAGQLSLRKGIPLLLQAWLAAALPQAELHLVGMWMLADGRRQALPPGVFLHGPVSAVQLRSHFQDADVFVFPSFFEGFGLVLLEAMACGLPAIATDATAGPDVLDESCGSVLPAGDLDALVEQLRWFGEQRDALDPMKHAARVKAQSFTWDRYRTAVRDATHAYC